MDKLILRLVMTEILYIDHVPPKVSIAEGIEEDVFENFREKPWNKEGKDNAEWVLIDFVDVVDDDGHHGTEWWCEVKDAIGALGLTTYISSSGRLPVPEEPSDIDPLPAQVGELLEDDVADAIINGAPKVRYQYIFERYQWGGGDDDEEEDASEH